ncbi:MAG TPA: hypothetical protein VMV27_09220 [Candidatus Binataceae bacterium]|nr:hypothetical protein [Candidatus Binataceae bacterium]
MVISGGLGGGRLSTQYGTGLENISDTYIGAGDASDFTSTGSELSPLPSSGTLANFRVQLSTNPTGSQSAGYEFLVYSCSVPSPSTSCSGTALTCDVIGPDTSCSDTVDTVPLTAGQLIYVESIAITGSESTIPGAAWSATYTH